MALLSYKGRGNPLSNQKQDKTNVQLVQRARPVRLPSLCAVPDAYYVCMCMTDLVNMNTIIYGNMCKIAWAMSSFAACSSPSPIPFLERLGLR